MVSKIVYEDRFGEEKEAGVIILSTDVDGELYEVLGVKVVIVDVTPELAQLELELNIDCREGYAIWPVLDSFGEYVWYDNPKQLVLCLSRGIWG